MRLFVKAYSHDSIFPICEKIKKLSVKLLSYVLVPQDFKGIFCIDYFLSVKNYWIIWM